MVSIAVSGAAGMISNHLLFKVTDLFISLCAVYLEAYGIETWSPIRSFLVRNVMFLMI
jgi:hypothetical protein